MTKSNTIILVKTEAKFQRSQKDIITIKQVICTTDELESRFPDC